MQSALYTLKNRSQNKDFKERFLQRALMHVAEYRIKHFFHKWRHNVDRLNLAELVNTEGDVVLERNQAQRNAKRLREELVSAHGVPRCSVLEASWPHLQVPLRRGQMSAGR